MVGWRRGHRPPPTRCRVLPKLAAGILWRLQPGGPMTPASNPSSLPAPTALIPAGPSGLMPLADRIVRLDSRVRRRRRLATRIADESARLEAELATLGEELAEGMRRSGLWKVGLPDGVSMVRHNAPRAIVPLWPANQFPVELRREVLELDEPAIRSEMGASEVLLDADGIELARLGPPRMAIEVRRVECDS